MLMKKAQVQEKCQTLMLQSMEASSISIDQSLSENPLKGLIEFDSLSKTGQRDLLDLVQICLDNTISPASDLAF